MGDVFKEQLVKRKPTRKDTLIKAGLIGACFFITFITVLFIPQIVELLFLLQALGFFTALT